MSTTKRIISGSAASWARIGVTVISQLALVPLYLSHWEVETFGIWLAIQALIGVLTTLDFGFQTYLEFEFLRIGKKNITILLENLWSGLFIGIIISIIQIVAIVILVNTSLLSLLLNTGDKNSHKLISDAGIVLIIQGFIWLFTTSAPGIFGRVLSPFGYFPRIAWWNVGLAIVFSLSSAVAVMFGAGLLGTGFISALCTLIFSLLFYMDIRYLFKKEKIKWIYPKMKLGVSNFSRSLALSAKIIFDNLRQQGIRIFLSPLAGLQTLAAFSTTRTAANFAMQGLNTITNPLMPELMRFLHQRDQVRCEAVFGIVWMVILLFMAPILVILQAFIEPLFFIWTRGKIPVNPSLFALLSLTVLIYSLAQPAIAIVRGNNLIKPQLTIAVLTAIVAIVTILILVPKTGIVGAGIALLFSEIIAAGYYQVIASKWLSKNGLVWPMTSSYIVLFSIIITSLSFLLIIIFPSFKWATLGISLTLLFWNVWKYWQYLPDFATSQVKALVKRIPVLKKVLSF